MRLLSLTTEEEDYVVAISRWTGDTPRRGLRFINVYRVIKASLDDVEIKRLEDGGYKALMTQLALTTGMPGRGEAWKRIVHEFSPDIPLTQAYKRIEDDGLEIPLGLKRLMETFTGSSPKSAASVREELSYYGHLARRYSFQMPDND